jgi:tetratricopeptide (TPR) repeat protein
MEHLFGVLLVWLLAAVWIFLLVNWAITGEVSAAEAALGSVVALLLAIASAQRAFPYVVPFSLMTLGGGAVALPVLRAYLNRAAHAQMDAELIERACLAYEFDPKNYGALINLAEVCYKNGLLEQAVHHLEHAIQQAPVMAANEKRRLRMWQDELQHHPKLGYTPCMHCGARSSVGGGAVRALPTPPAAATGARALGSSTVSA